MGKKRIKGEGVYRDELKKTTAIVLTPTAILALDTRAHTLGLSRSELIERMARGELTMLPEQEETTKKRKRSQKLPSAG